MQINVLILKNRVQKMKTSIPRAEKTGTVNILLLSIKNENTHIEIHLL